MIKFKLKEIMEDKNIKISDLNESTGISRNSLSLLINGKSRGVQFETLEKIVSALDINIGDLFEKTFNNLEIVLHNTQKITGARRQPYDNANEKSKSPSKTERFALECTIYEDDIVRKGFIPYNLNLEINPKPQLIVDIALNYSEFYSFFRTLFENDRRLSYIFYDYFVKKVLFNEKEKIDLIKNTFDINLDYIHSRLSGGGKEAYIFVYVDTTEESNKTIEDVLNELNTSNIFTTEYTDSIKIYSK